MEIQFKEFKVKEENHKYQIIGTLDGMSISDYYDRDSKLWRLNRWMAEKRIMNGFVHNYKNEIKDAYKNYRCK